MNKQWKKFDHLTETCYSDMASGVSDINNWNTCFTLLLEIISDGREANPDFAKELYLLDDETDYCHDVQGWLEDYLDELDMREMYPELESACRKLLTLFEWKEEYPSEIRFLLASALGNQGKPEEALKYCENWEADETGNPLAAAALIYAKIKMKDLEGAEEVVKRYIAEDTVCTEENDVIFTAALRLYKENGNKEMEKKMDDILEEYDKKLGEYLTGLGEEDLEFIDDEMPFNCCAESEYISIVI